MPQKNFGNELSQKPCKFLNKKQTDKKNEKAESFLVQFPCLYVFSTFNTFNTFRRSETIIKTGVAEANYH